MLVSSLPWFWSCRVVFGLLGVMWFYSMAFEVNSSHAFVAFRLCLAILIFIDLWQTSLKRVIKYITFIVLRTYNVLNSFVRTLPVVYM